MTTVADGLFQYGGMPVTPGVPVPFTGTAWFVDPVNGADGNSGKAPNRAFATLYRAHEMAADGNNDVVYLIGNGQSSGSARLSTANAQSVTSSATAGTLTWSKNALHLVGIAAPGQNSRARIATPTGTYLQSTFNSLKFMEIPGSGNYFSNLALFQQFSTGANGEICLEVAGDRNVFSNVFVGGLASTAAAQGTAGRSLKMNGGEENTFIRCQIGLDTVTRTVANASLEFAAAAARNSFVECILPFQTSNAGVLGILGTGAACMDRWQTFERCMFINNIKSTSTQMTVLASLTNASPGGLLLFKDCDTIGMTKIGDTNALANSYVSNVGGAATGALDVNPS